MLQLSLMKNRTTTLTASAFLFQQISMHILFNGTFLYVAEKKGKRLLNNQISSTMTICHIPAAT
jgi:hypothetical protein